MRNLKKDKTVYAVTSLPISPEEDNRIRFRNYTIAMLIRTACVVALIFVEGWMLLVVALGAIFLPYFAVVTANAKVGNSNPMSEIKHRELPTEAEPAEKVN